MINNVIIDNAMIYIVSIIRYKLNYYTNLLYKKLSYYTNSIFDY